MPNKADSLLNFHEFKEKKQRLAEEKASNIYDMARGYAERSANIREKVRGKHIFCSMTGISNAEPLSDWLEEAFFQWFLFDYKTISGKTIFHTFLYSRQQQWTEPDFIQGALFLTAALEPVEITEVHSDREFKARNLTASCKEVQIKSAASRNVSKGYAFLRKIPLLTKEMLVGDIFVVNTPERIDMLLKDYKKASLEHNGLAWRTYLKENSMKYAFSPDVQTLHSHSE
ncbi:hypothetical protein [Falsibacillus pallidus]|uniref:Uncharacterized protein n=1 Tax=Falsibacillus pallidus TaxID=493781 RepID=A0A370GKV3_9BACI|nr:hypothetical protein [Falsibacillus pallidus]RDI44311.1 hypothetical protein DFR59_103383 [Falsibacillus pallidus]